MSRWPAWTPEEVALLREHYPTGGSRAVQEAGVGRALKPIRMKARALSVRYVGPNPAQVSVLSTPEELMGNLTPQPFAMTPSRPRRITDALHRLAETPGLTERQYTTRKAAILREGRA